MLIVAGLDCGPGCKGLVMDKSPKLINTKSLTCCIANLEIQVKWIKSVLVYATMYNQLFSHCKMRSLSAALLSIN